MQKNEEYNIDKFININLSDSRNLSLKDESIDLIVTSPPYVTSYEYADLHRFHLLWLDILRELLEFRKKIIGSIFREHKEIKLQSYFQNL